MYIYPYVSRCIYVYMYVYRYIHPFMHMCMHLYPYDTPTLVPKVYLNKTYFELVRSPGS